MTTPGYVILSFVPYYLPGYKSGGPIRTMANMVDRMGDEFDFKIITLDRDSGDNHSYPEINVNAWNQVGKARVFYCSPSQLTLSFLRRFLSATAHDVLYLNSFFDPVFTIKPLLLRYMKLVPSRPVVIAPRGEFSAGALGIKAWKKGLYLFCAKSLGLYRNLVWQGSTVHEAEDIRNVMGGMASNIVVAVNLPPLSGKTLEPRWPEKSGQCLRVAFLSRISRKKNLDYALNALKQVRARVRYDLFGTLEDRAYWKTCCDIIRKLPDNIAVEYKGEVPHENVSDLLSGYDLFFFPTRGENYGHVIHEALAAGLPVLISDQTPWRDLQKEGVGWDLPLDDVEAFSRLIDEVAGMDAQQHRRMRYHAREYGQTIQNDDASLQANRRLFLQTTRAPERGQS